MPVTDVAATPAVAKSPAPRGAPSQNSSFSPEKISELVQLLAATKLENERLRSAALPDRTNAELEKLLGESLLYAWMQSLAVALREYSRMDPNWASHPLAQSIWTVVHEELLNKRQGRNSTMPIPQPQPQGPVAAPGMMMRQQGMQIATPGGPRIIGGPQNNTQCFICGGPGHWARNCPQAAVTGTLHQPHGRAKISQVGDQTILTSNKGWSFDLNGPPPSHCRRCGGMHWEMFPCGQANQLLTKKNRH